MLVPLQTKDGTALVVLDKDTDTANNVLDTLFDSKKIKGDATQMADKIIKGVKQMAGKGLAEADLVSEIAKPKAEL